MPIQRKVTEHTILDEQKAKDKTSPMKVKSRL